MALPRCINLDWLEVYCLEDPARPLAPEEVLTKDTYAEVRPYGTRQYSMMFKLCTMYGEPILEVRRCPIATKDKGGIFEPNACHIRLTNRLCYASNAIEILSSFCSRYNVQIVSIFRVDICLDFERFDTGDDPQKFIKRYIKGKYAKINQSRLHAHGEDTWETRLWNSLSWGKDKAPIGTKLYNKTQELKEVKDKPWIRQAWFESHLVDDPVKLIKVDSQGNEYKPTIWRLEFSIRSKVKGWLTMERDGNEKKYISVRNNLSCYDSPDKRLVMFNSLARHYFSFRKYKYGKSKYECEEKTLFRFSTDETFYKVEHPSVGHEVPASFDRLEKMLQEFRLLHPDIELNKAVDTLLKYIHDERTRGLLENPYSKEQLLALQLAIAARMKNNTLDPVKLIHELEETIQEYPSIW